MTRIWTELSRNSETVSVQKMNGSSDKNSEDYLVLLLIWALT